MLHFEMVPRRWQTLADWKSEMDNFWQEAQGALQAPPCEIVEGEKAYLIALDIPGFRKEDIQLEVKDRQLLVSGERHEQARNENDRVLRQERRFGRFQRVFTLPANIAEDGVEASFTDGVLRVTLPKSDTGTRKITVN